MPGIAGASGYASAYSSASVVVAGFDLGESHVVPISEEDIDYGDPPVAAQDVVDRAALQAFVTAAGEYFIDPWKPAIWPLCRMPGSPCGTRTGRGDTVPCILLPWTVSAS